MKKIEDLENLEQKKVLIRLDLNVPLKNNQITDATRIEKILPSLNFLIKKNCKIVIISHLGRPKGKVDKQLSMKPICDYLSKKLDKKIRLIEKNIFGLHQKKFANLKFLYPRCIVLKNQTQDNINDL